MHAEPNAEQVERRTEHAPGAGVFAPDLLAGRVALVTGGGSGIGFGISACLASCGASVAIASRSRERLEEAAERLRAATGGRVLPVVGNVREPQAMETAAATVADELGSLDILVNNAAGNFYCRTEELTPNGWRAVVETDLYGTFHASRAAFPLMRERGFGRIVSISMTLHYRGWPLMAHATAAKAGIDALTRTLALEWARHGITVNAVAPGPIPTEGVKEAFTRGNRSDGGDGGNGDDPGGGGDEGAEGGGDAPPEPFDRRAADAYARRFIPAGRLGRPEDIGRMVTYLVSPAGDWITGAILVVDGGESLASPRRLPGREP